MSEPNTSGIGSTRSVGLKRGSWTILRRKGSAEDLLAPWPDPKERSTRLIALCEVEGSPTLVMGSTQGVRNRLGAKEFDNEGNIRLATRLTGGGAVFVAPAAQIWMDAWIPRGDRLWEEDVVRSATWMGELWAEALRKLEIAASSIEVHQAGATRTVLSDAICYAGIGPGEIRIGGRKLVGLAQRRNRDGSWFHAMAYRRWSARELLEAAAKTGSLDLAGFDQQIEYLENAAVGLEDVVPHTHPTDHKHPTDDTHPTDHKHPTDEIPDSAVLFRQVEGALIEAAEEIP